MSVAQIKLREWAVRVIRSITAHTSSVVRAFLSDPAPFLTAPLTVAQRCNIFNTAMSAAGVGLKMPTDAAGNKVWDVAVFDRGVALTEGRTPEPTYWAHQRYQPLVGLDGKRRKSFYSLITGAALEGGLTGVDPKTFASTAKHDADNTETCDCGACRVRRWYISSVNGLCGTKDKPGILAQSRGFNVAVRADLPARAGKTVRSAASMASLLAEVDSEPEGTEVTDAE